MSSAFEDMDMEVSMEENLFEDGGMPAESSKKEENGFLDGFTDIDALGENPFDSDEEGQAAVSFPVQQGTVSNEVWPDTEENSDSSGTDETEGTRETEKDGMETSDTEKESEDKKRAEHEAAE